jgi:hypothetical protein
MLDMFSLAWRINLVEKGIGNAEILLPTYESERRSVAQELLKFDAACTCASVAAPADAVQTLGSSPVARRRAPTS